MQTSAREPIFNLPGVIVVLFGVLVAVHLMREFLSQELDDWVLAALAFVPARFGERGSALPGAPWAGPASFVTHTLLHGDWLHLAMNSVWLMAVGSPIARRMSAPAFIGFAAVCGAGGALLFLAIHPGLAVPMVGASGAISGLMAAVFRLIFSADDDHARHLLREDPAAVPRLSLGQTFKSRQATAAIAVWIVVNMLAAFGFGALDGTSGIAWEAHLGGFLTGLLAFGLFDRGQGPVTRRRSDA